MSSKCIKKKKKNTEKTSYIENYQMHILRSVTYDLQNIKMKCTIQVEDFYTVEDGSTVFYFSFVC